MNEFIERLVDVTGGDGASASVGVQAISDRAEVEQLLEAWSRECGRSIESTLLLGRVHRLLSRILAEGRLNSRGMREARRILRAIALIEEEYPATGA